MNERRHSPGIAKLQLGSGSVPVAEHRPGWSLAFPALLALLLCACHTLPDAVHTAMAQDTSTRFFWVEMAREMHQIADTRTVIDGDTFAELGVAQWQDAEHPATNAALRVWSREFLRAYHLYGPGSEATFAAVARVGAEIEEGIKLN